MAHVLRMPEVSANLTEATLLSWIAVVDAPYAQGDPIFTVETDKAVVDVEAEAEGKLLRVLCGEGVQVEVGMPIAIWGSATDAVDEPEVDRLVESLWAGGSGQPDGNTSDRGAADPPAQVGETASSAEQPNVRLFSSPLARKLAREAGIDIADVPGTGPRGRIRRQDIEDFVARRTAQQPAPAAAAATRSPASPQQVADYEDLPVSRMRLAIARRLTESVQTAPHFHLTGRATVDALIGLRRDLNRYAATKVSFNDLVVKAVGRAHSLVPELNVNWRGDSIRQFGQVDVAVAVATDAGLVTPVIRGVDRMSVTELAEASADLIERAAARTLRQAELEGGTVTVSNLGMFGTEEFSAIINPPHASILAVGHARPEVVVEDGEPTVATQLRVTLVVDHRPVDGATAARWMQVFVDALENPIQLLL